MKFSTTFQGIVLSLAVIFISPATAEELIKDSSELIGTWALDATSKDREGDKRPSGQVWDFRKDGTLISTTSGDRRAQSSFSVTSRYEILDGKLVCDVPGRPGKKLSYQLIEKSGAKMILRQGIGEFMFFTKQ